MIGIKVEVRLFATLRNNRWKNKILEIEDDVTPSYIFDMLKIKEDEVAILLINGRDGKFDRVLKNGDVLSIFPPVGGG